MSGIAVNARMDADTECYQHSMPANQLTYQGGLMATAHNTLVPSAISPVIISTKTCTSCNIEKPFAEFSPSRLGKFGLRTRCKPCHNASQRKSRKANPEPLRSVWDNLKTRCNNLNCSGHGRYGGRGIAVCERWANSYEAFESDMGAKPTPEHQIDRIDNDGNYEPSNCRWATPAENSANRGMRCDNKLGITGVTWLHEAGVPHGRYTAQITRNGIKRLKYFTDFFEACCWRKSREINFRGNTA